MQEIDWKKCSAFNSGLRDELRLGKYTRQYADLTGEQLAGLLWLLGEYVLRADPLDMARAVVHGERRKVAAHNALCGHVIYTLDHAKQLGREAAGLTGRLAPSLKI